MTKPFDAKQDRLDKLLAKKKAIEARIRLTQGRERKQRHKEETRRKVLAGAAVMTEAAHRPEYHRELMRLLDRFLVRPDERELFDLTPLPPMVEELTARQTPGPSDGNAGGLAACVKL